MSPRARRFAEERDFHPANLSGSGPGGRVLEADVKHAYFMRSHEDAPVIAAGEKVSSIREKIARRMRESLASTAQYTLHGSADASGLLAMRARVKASQAAADVNINDLVAYCTIDALREAPEVNAEFIDGRLIRHSAIHLGFACDTPRGLIVPVVRDAQAMTAPELAARMKDLAAKAVAGSLTPDVLAGATFTISNLGGLGIEWFTPLLNPPQVAILGVGAIGLQPVRRGAKVEFVDTIRLSLTCDHQVVDGAPGARFLAVVRKKIESVETLWSI